MENKDFNLTGFLNDGVRRIDIILVVEEGTYKEKVEKIKIDFLINVIKIGLEIEIEAAVMKHYEKLLFIKVHAPDALIVKYGSYYNVRKYFKEIHNEFINPNLNFFDLKIEKELIKIIRKYYPGPLNYSNVERSTIVYHILLSLPFGLNENFVGLQRLLESNIIVDVYALHDGPYFFPQNQIPDKINGRQALFYNWVGKRNMFKSQPIHLIREYFGEKVAFYFAFYEFFNIALIFAIMLGIYVTGECIYDKYDDKIINEACSDKNVDPNSVRTVCPLCRDFNVCPFRNLTDYCIKVAVTHFIDNPWTIIYCILISLWVLDLVYCSDASEIALQDFKCRSNINTCIIDNYIYFIAILFILIWRRRKNYLSWMWEYDQADSIKDIRSDFETDVKNIRKSNLTGNLTDTDSLRLRILRLVLTISVLAVSAIFAMVIAISLIIWKYQLAAKFEKIKNIWGVYLGVIIITCINILAMTVFLKISRNVSYQLTRFENHKTYNSFQSSYVIKTYIFGFICNFSLMICIYFLNFLYTYPSDKSRWYMIGGIGMLNCGPETCSDELCVELLIAVLFKEFVLKFPAAFLKIKTDYSPRLRNLPCWEREYLLQPLTEFILIEKLSDLVLKFTLVGLFDTVFPMTTLLFLIHGILNIRYEARLFLVGYRRPLLRQPSSQRVWYKILLGIVFAAPCFNTLAMTWMTTMLPYSTSNNVTSYFTFSMGRFVTEDYKKVTGPGSPAEALENYKGFVPTECLFPGLRYRSKKFDGNYYPIERLWQTKYDKYKFMLEVEHIALMLMIVFHCAIPSYPRDIINTVAVEEKIKRRRRYEIK